MFIHFFFFFLFCIDWFFWDWVLLSMWFQRWVCVIMLCFFFFIWFKLIFFNFFFLLKFRIKVWFGWVIQLSKLLKLILCSHSVSPFWLFWSSVFPCFLVSKFFELGPFWIYSCYPWQSERNQQMNFLTFPLFLLKVLLLLSSTVGCWIFNWMALSAISLEMCPIWDLYFQSSQLI